MNGIGAELCGQSNLTPAVPRLEVLGHRWRHHVPTPAAVPDRDARRLRERSAPMRRLGTTTCVPLTPAGPSQCNGLDNNCDGTIDTGPCGSGLCATEPRAFRSASKGLRHRADVHRGASASRPTASASCAQRASAAWAARAWTIAPASRAQSTKCAVTATASTRARTSTAAWGKSARMGCAFRRALHGVHVGADVRDDGTADGQCVATACATVTCRAVRCARVAPASTRAPEPSADARGVHRR